MVVIMSRGWRGGDCWLFGFVKKKVAMRWEEEDDDY